jgi:hypothetical protein
MQGTFYPPPPTHTLRMCGSTTITGSERSVRQTVAVCHTHVPPKRNATGQQLSMHPRPGNAFLLMLTLQVLLLTRRHESKSTRTAIAARVHLQSHLYLYPRPVIGSLEAGLEPCVMVGAGVLRSGSSWAPPSKKPLGGGW